MYQKKSISKSEMEMIDGMHILRKTGKNENIIPIAGKNK